MVVAGHTTSVRRKFVQLKDGIILLSLVIGKAHQGYKTQLHSSILERTSGSTKRQEWTHCVHQSQMNHVINIRQIIMCLLLDSDGCRLIHSSIKIAYLLRKRHEKQVKQRMRKSLKELLMN